jgi:hypothetical protein
MILQEKIYSSEFLLAEARGYRSRDTVVVAASQTLLPGAVIGAQTVGALSAAVVPKVGNTGNGVLAPVAPAAGTPLGNYKVKFLDANHYQVFSPAAPGLPDLDGEGVVGVNYAGAISFALPAGGAAFAEEDEIDVTISAAAGSGDVVAWNPAAADGSQNVSGVLYSGVTTVAGQTAKAAAITRDAEVKQALLQFVPGLTTLQQAAAIQQLAALGIITRA